MCSLRSGQHLLTLAFADSLLYTRPWRVCTLSYCSGITEDTRHRWDSRLSNRPVSSVDTPLWNPRRPTTVRGGSNSLLRCARCNRILQTTETCTVQGSRRTTTDNVYSQSLIAVVVYRWVHNKLRKMLIFSFFKYLFQYFLQIFFQEAQLIHYKKTILLEDTSFDVFSPSRLTLCQKFFTWNAPRLFTLVSAQINYFCNPDDFFKI